MTSSQLKELDMSQNPIDLVEDVVVGLEWSCHRVNEEQLMVEIEGRWTEYNAQVFWQEDFDIIQFAIPFEIDFEEEASAETFKLIALVNNYLLLGHFEYSEEDKIIAYRYAYFTPDAKNIKPEDIEDILEMALFEADRFFPAFQFVIDGEKKATDAIALALLETMGEA